MLISNCPGNGGIRLFWAANDIAAALFAFPAINSYPTHSLKSFLLSPVAKKGKVVKPLRPISNVLSI